jgi:uncharacterized membrane protein
MMDGGMGSMMAWMMGFGLLGWLVVIGLLIAILVVLVRMLSRQSALGDRQRQGREEKLLQER